MQLTAYTDYSLRMLMYLAVLPKGELATLREISNAYGVSINHLKKVLLTLSRKGFVKTVQGRNGGIQLAIEPGNISIGQLVRSIENLEITDCFKEDGYCILSPVCTLSQILNLALEAMLAVLDEHTLGDLVVNEEQLQNLLFSKANRTEQIVNEEG